MERYNICKELHENALYEPFLKLTDNFLENDLVYKQKVFLTDIDYSRHTNNVSYVKFIINTLSSEFIDKYIIIDFEIHYINESKEGQILSIYKQEKEDSMEFFIKKDEREIVRANLIYNKKGM